VILSPDEALANSAAAHHLGGDAGSLPDLAAKLIGLHNTNQSTPYLSVRARLDGFTRSDLETAMWDEWALARFRTMRLTIFVLPIDLLEIAAAATRPIRTRLADQWMRDSGLERATFDAIAEDIVAALTEGPMTSRALRDALNVRLPIDLPGIVSRMCDTGHLVGGAPPRNWRSGIRQYHRTIDVLPTLDLERWAESDAIRELVGRYVESYGPVTLDDIAWWTGLTKARCRAALDDLDLEEVTVQGWPGPMWRTGSGRGELPDAVRALPLLDPYAQGYRNRVRYLNPARHDWVHDRGGNATATIVHRGRIIGVWQTVEKPKRQVLYHLFDTQTASIRRAAEDDVAAAGAFYFEQPVDISEVRTMTSLHADGGRSAAHPLDGHIHRRNR